MTPKREKQIRSDAAYQWEPEDGDSMDWADDCKVLLAEIDTLRRQLAEAHRLRRDVMSSLDDSLKDEFDARKLLGESQIREREKEAEIGRLREALTASGDYLSGRPNSDGLKRVTEQLEAALAQSAPAEPK